MSEPRFNIRSSKEYCDSAGKLEIFNSLGSRKEIFEPLDKTSKRPQVKLYVCGITPYDTAHMGHLVPALHFDLLRNYLEYRNLKVNFVQNITDIDDKIINRARETGEDALTLTRRVSDLFYSQLGAMHIRLPDRIVRVTESMPQIIAYISDLIASGFAYSTESGNVYFELGKRSDSEYGKLSNQRLSELRESGRIESESDKRSPLDFALWKNDDSSSLSHESPWGRGRPGWHIECSVMIDDTLGTPIDIHGGGLDLKFPHHENEIVQSEAHDGHEFARYWMHSGLLTIDGTKMSKSLGNFMTIDDAFKRFGPELIRYVFLIHHYRSNVNLSDKLFMENINSLFDFYKGFEQWDNPNSGYSMDYASSAALLSEFEKALNDDLNAPRAMVALRKSLSACRNLQNSADKKAELSSLIGTIRQCGHVMGLFHFSFSEILEQGLRFSAQVRNSEPVSLSELENLLRERQKVRQEKNYAESDKIRDRLSEMGLEYLDLKEPVNSGMSLFLGLRFKGL